jgi:hypothetical protein
MAPPTPPLASTQVRRGRLRSGGRRCRRHLGPLGETRFINAPDTETKWDA